MTVSLNEWSKYRDLLSKLSQKAADEFKDAVWNVNGRWHGAGLGAIPREDLIEYAHALVTKYSEGSSELACEMYDAMAKLSGKLLPAAEPVEPASIYDVGRSLNSAIRTSLNPDYVSSTVGRFVKQASQDTTLKNARRDGAEFAWIPSGDACPFCIMLASNGWRRASKKSSSHAEHIHNNCNCAYAVRFDSESGVKGYNPDEYLEQYQNAEGRTTKEKVNSMRRMQYQENKDVINAQKREAYAERKEAELAQHKDGDKVFITDQAIEKVKEVAPSTSTDEEKELMMELNKEILRVSKESNNSDEVAMAIVDGKIGKPVLGDNSSVNLLSDADMYHALKSKDIEPHSVIVSHNHPGLSYFSVHDVGIFVQHQNIKTMEVVTNTGKTWYISKKNNYDDIEAFNLYKKAIKENSENPEAAVDSFLKSVYNMVERNK